MFKLESYITPLLMGYIDKYVKLKKEDFQLSLWGGDAVLNKLDLRLDAIEHALNLPITFKSGQIYELRIHVPWTKLGSEAVVITINTIECILKLKDSASSDSDSASNVSSTPRSAASKPRMSSKDAGEDLPPGYLQSLIGRIVNNVNIVVNNLIVKFVEDDIVLSLNAKSAECYSVGSDWIRSFVELAQPELVLRRVINFHDLTVCLDKRDASGKIQHYQDPLLYRCSLTCRMHMLFDSLHAKLPSVTKFNVMCEHLDISLTDTQLPMFIRLVELVITIYYRAYLKNAQARIDARKSHLSDGDKTEEGDLMDDDPDYIQGWGSWAWSYVPAILPTDEEYGDEEPGQRKKRAPPILSIGLYMRRASVTFKLTEYQQEMAATSTGSTSSAKLSFHPTIVWLAEGITLEVLVSGVQFADVQFGITSTKMVSEGAAPCGVRDLSADRENWFFRAGNPLNDKAAVNVNYISHSLFDPGGAENRGENSTYICDVEGHSEVLTEKFVAQRFGAFHMDYVYAMSRAEDSTGNASSRSSVMSISDEDVQETATIKFLLSPAHLIVSSGMVQRVHKLIHAATDHEYEPYMKKSEGVVEPDIRAPIKEESVSALEKFIATRSLQLTLLKPCIWVQANYLQSYDVTKKWMTFYSKLKKKKVPTATLR